LFSLLVLTFVAAPVAFAQVSGVSGSFASSFEMVVDNCKGAGATLEKATIEVTQNGNVLSISIPTLPQMKGKLGKRGKLRAEASASSDGVRGQYSLNGRVTGKRLQAVLVAEFFKGDKPQCTQSWSVTGKRANR
jgi:hypothetical protein